MDAKTDNEDEAPMVQVTMTAPEWYAVKQLALEGILDVRARINIDLRQRNRTAQEMELLGRLAGRAEIVLNREAQSFHDREAELDRQVTRIKTAPKDTRE